MPTHQVKRVSHLEPNKFRINYEDAKRVLVDGVGEDSLNNELPVKKTQSEVAIVGGGFGGLSTALTCLKKLNINDFTIFERHDNFGGTWYANTYPGCASDIPALWYSFFEELNSNWSELQPPQYEMEEYIMEVVNKYRLKDHGRFKTYISKFVYNEEAGNWKLYGQDLKTGQKIEHTARVVAMCKGGLVRPRQLDSKGLENFEGTYIHSAVWDHDVSFKDKDVLVVGNGCSATQVIPALLGKDYDVKSLTQVSRSKHHIMPPVPSIVHFLYRVLSFSRFTMVLYRLLVAAVAEARYPLYKGNGILARIVRWVNRKQSDYYIDKTAPEQYRKDLKPDFKIGCKRMIYDKKYVPSLHDPRVKLTTENIDRIEKDYVIMKTGERIKTDIIVACTGYDIDSHFTSEDVIGRNGFDAGKTWRKEGVTAYRTILIRDCPNFFVIGGPNSATGHSSVVLAIENGTNYFSKVASKVLSHEYKTVCVKTEKYYEWFENTQKELSKAVFGTEFGGCISWYTKGGINSTAYPYSQVQYWWAMGHPNWDDHEFEK